ncbi:MAG: hypothetical protein EZS28_036806, partial [Streblomastix strix]
MFQIGSLLRREIISSIIPPLSIEVRNGDGSRQILAYYPCHPVVRSKKLSTHGAI